MSLENPSEYVQLCEIKSNSVSSNSSIVREITTNFQSPIVLTDSAIVAPDVVIPIECSQSGERIISNQQLGALQSNGTKYGKQYGKDRLYSKTNNIRSNISNPR